MNPAEQSSVPLLGFCAYSGTGKTTLLTRLLPLLKKRGLRVGMLKHAHHEFDIDQFGKDSFRLREAGAVETLVASKKRWALIHNDEQAREEPNLWELLPRLDLSQLDLVLVEGFKHEDFPKIEIHRPSMGRDMLFPHTQGVIAVAVDEALGFDTKLPLLDINSPEEIVEFILENLL